MTDESFNQLLEACKLAVAALGPVDAAKHIQEIIDRTPAREGVDIDLSGGYSNQWNEHDFPLTQQEAWFVMRGYPVKPKRPVNVDLLLTLPGQLEMSDGYIMLRER